MTQYNMRAIQTVTVGAGGAASIEFTSIPQTYTDLVVKLSVRTTRAGTDVDDEIQLEFNGSGGTAYKARMAEGNGTTTRSAADTSQPRIGRGHAPSDNATANIFSNSEYYISNYRSSNNKCVSFDTLMENNATLSYISLASGLWANSAAITSMKFTAYGTFDQYSTATLYGVTSAAVGAKATGGAIYQDTNYFYHVFAASGTFTPTQSLTADCLVVAGGGGSGYGGGGGGGAGGLLGFTSQSLSATAYTVTVGGGGAASPSSSQAGVNGNNSQFGGLTACVGGGGGDTSVGTGGGKNGGSGGGGNGRNTPFTGGTGTSGQGTNGGAGFRADPNVNEPAGGGGGATVAGGTATALLTGTGGNGSSSYSSWGLATSSGENVDGTYWFAGGGAGGKWTGTAVAASGGNGGGGDCPTTGVGGNAGQTNTGGGASGGFGPGVSGANGGSGIVIVRYAK